MYSQVKQVKICKIFLLVLKAHRNLNTIDYICAYRNIEQGRLEAELKTD